MNIKLNLRLALVTTLTAILALVSCSQSNDTKSMNNPQQKALVCYFSATGTTAEAAKRIATITGADIHEIAPETRYTSDDLDWTDNQSRCYVEMHNRTFRPALADTVKDIDKYSIIFIGYPNWWNTHPTIINTFIETHNLSGKTIIPFMTSGGSDIINSEKELRESYPGLTFGKGLLINSKSDREIKEWLADNNLSE